MATELEQKHHLIYTLLRILYVSNLNLTCTWSGSWSDRFMFIPSNNFYYQENIEILSFQNYTLNPLFIVLGKLWKITFCFGCEKYFRHKLDATIIYDGDRWLDCVQCAWSVVWVVCCMLQCPWFNNQSRHIA